MRSSIPKIVFVVLILLAGGEKLFATNVGGLICTDTTWTSAGSPYVVTSGIVIGCNATLTIEADVVVKFNSQLAIMVGSNAFGNGMLVARGTAESPIIFTSVKDPNSVLDPAKPGDWSRIHFTDYAVDVVFDADNYVSGCILEHVVVEYAGYGNYGAIFAEKSSPFLTYCEVRHNLYYGIQVDGTSAPPIRITNSEIWDHPQRGIYISGGAGGNRLLNNNIHDNRSGGIYFGSVGSNTLTGNTVSGNTGGGGVYFYYSGSNTLTGNTFTGNTGGGGIQFRECWGGNNILTGNTVSDNISGGAGGGIDFISSSSNTLTGNTISNNTASGDGGGIRFVSSTGCGFSNSNTLTGNTISGNTSSGAGGGIYFFLSSSNTLTANTIQRNTSLNGLGALCFFGSGSNNILSCNVITGNLINTGMTGGVYAGGSGSSGYCQNLSLAGEPDIYNIIWGNDGYQVYNNSPFYADGRYDVNAVYVRWGTCDIQQIMDGIFDYFDDATKAFVVFYPFVCVIPGDFDVDEDVDWFDLATFVDNWLRQDCTIPDWCEGADLNFSKNVDFVDFAYFAEHWLEGTGP